MILKPAQVSGGVVKSVGMVNTQAVHLTVRDQAKYQSVRGLEDIFALHGERGQVVDVKESAVVDLVGSHSPVREAVALILEQVIQKREAVRVARAARKASHVAVDKIPDRLAFRGQRRQPALDHFLLTLAFRNFFGLGIRAAREVAHGRRNTLVLDEGRILGTQGLFQILEAVAEDSVVRAWCHRKTAIAVMDKKRSVAKRQAELAGLEHVAIEVGKDGEKHLVAQLGPQRRLPGDVEIRSVTR